MLPAAHRIRCSKDFHRAVRTGTRVGRRNLVIHLRSGRDPVPPRVGFVVSRAIGSATVRNLVKRRLRSAMAPQIANLPPGTDVVVRALPSSSSAKFSELNTDLTAGVTKALAREKSGKAVK